MIFHLKPMPKDGNLKSNKSITVSILEAIKPGMKSNDFIESIEKKIYSELDLIS